MEPTGFDTVIFTFVRPRLVFRQVVAAIATSWPASLVEDLDDRQAGSQTCSLVEEDRLPSEAGVLLFLRDRMMAQHLEDHGYTPMDDGDGPFAVWFRKRAGVEFRLGCVNELHVEDNPPRLGQVDPYPAWFCSPVVYEMTLVTPDNPEAHPFSKWVCRIVRKASAGLTT
jgi:hypothetical protein